MSRSRPSPKEINRKLIGAKECIRANKYAFYAPDEVYDDLIELGADPANLRDDLKAIFEEILPGYYRGGRPPQRSYEEGICGLDLWAFSWTSAHFGANVYFKFALAKQKTEYLWLVSLHEDRPPKKGHS